MTAPLPLHAASAAELVTTADTQPVTRGIFIRAAVKALALPTPEQKYHVEDARKIPPSLAPFIRAAEEHHALDVFGTDLELREPITRGEALFVLVALADRTTGSINEKFRDVPPGSEFERSVVIALSEHWIKPLRQYFFGVRTPLSGRDARLLLSRVMLKQNQENSGSSIQIIRIQTHARSEQMPPKQDILTAVWHLLQKEYLRRDTLDPDEVGNAAVEGLVNSLKDPYTVYFRPVKAKNFESQIQGELSGIGAQVEQKGDLIVIVSPLKGSPAERAGLLPGDEVLMVDDASIKGLSLDDAVAKIRGPKGSVVKLHIRRSGTELDFSITRDTVKVPEIEITWQGTIAILKLYQFGQITNRDLRAVLTDVEQRGPHGFILDLRNNPGGLLTAADLVAGNFLPKGSTVAQIVSPDETTDEVTDDAPTIDPSIKMVVLVNKGSASASEIVAGALQDTKRATIVGETTFGKGTVQEVVPFTDGSSLKMTVAEWKTPLGRKIDGVGVKPDYEVKREQGERDDQLLKALDLLR